MDFAPDRMPTVAQVLAGLGPPPAYQPSPVPAYQPRSGPRIFLALEDYQRHMTDEGWQLQLGMQQAGYELWGYKFPDRDCVDVPRIVTLQQPSTVILQDKREWDPSQPGAFSKQHGFRGSEWLASRPEVFRLTICKDAHQNPAYHEHAHREIGTHAWITYYELSIVRRLAPWLRPQHCVRTWHSVDPLQVPAYQDQRPIPVILSGALGSYYPLRTRLEALVRAGELPGVFGVPHPGYGAKGVCTPDFLQLLSRCKVAICTCSRLGYALRKIVEAVACGCRVITNLPVDDPLPHIDANLVRIPNDITPQELNEVVRECLAGYSAETQAEYAAVAKRHYDYRQQGQQLARAIEELRTNYA